MVSRRLPVVAAGLCGCVLVATSAALDGSLSAPLVPPPEPSLDGTTGPSLFALLLAWLREVFGISFEGALGGSAPPVVPPVVLAFATLVVAGGCLAVVLLLTRRGGVTGSGDRLRPSPDPDGSPPWPPTARNPLDRAWVALVARLDADRPHALTTREWAGRAVEDGYDRRTVRRLRSAVEEGHYAADGPADPTEVARRARRRLGIDETDPTDRTGRPERGERPDRTADEGSE
ncbi:hypothetical protein [Halomarina oriensis]|uniref:DUF4129 domain-containing protein n=1 Tax=Halomarina oriensis TaxID=671145 RepID=A0A6B0GMI5_9EURY|nr:hypothetical protein [Halomarina oriensis]MWG36072.1 hypothetical protein [Halomarina oriensis]